MALSNKEKERLEKKTAETVVNDVRTVLGRSNNEQNSRVSSQLQSIEESTSTFVALLRGTYDEKLQSLYKTLAALTTFDALNKDHPSIHPMLMSSSVRLDEFVTAAMRELDKRYVVLTTFKVIETRLAQSRNRCSTSEALTFRTRSRTWRRTLPANTATCVSSDSDS